MALQNPRDCHLYHHQLGPTACFYKESITGTQPPPSLMYRLWLLSCLTRWPVFFLTTLTIMAKLNSCDGNHMAHVRPKILIIWLFAEKVPIPNLYEWSRRNCAVPRLCRCTWWHCGWPWPLGSCTSLQRLVLPLLTVFASLHGSQPRLCKQREPSFPPRSFPANLSQYSPLSLLLAALIPTATLPKPLAP